MRRILVTLTTAAAIAAVGLPATADLTIDENEAMSPVKAVIGDYVRPAFANFEEVSGQSAEVTADLCATPDDEALAAARSAFEDSVRAFARVEFLRLGPLVQENRIERLLFWPDRRGIGLRQVQAAIIDKDPTVTKLQSLQQKSVALQGYTTLEFLLYGTGAEDLAAEGADHRCRFAETVAANIHDVARTVNEEWQAPDGIARTWSEPGPENNRFRDAEEALGELVSIPAEAFELIRDQRVQPIAPPDDPRPNPKQALLWRSDMTFSMIENSLEGLRDYSDAANLGDILPEDQSWLAGSVQFEFENAQRTVKKLDMPVEEIVANEEKLDDLHYLMIVLKSLNTQFGQQITAAFGLIAGFSSLDGD